MPRLPIDYANTIIYKIVCNDLNITECYVGHTTDIVRRKYDHKSNCKNETNKYHNLKIYKAIRENGGWENWCMVIIEKYPCKDVSEACIRERYYYEQLHSNLNMKFPQRNKKEYQEINKEKMVENAKAYYIANREQHLSNVHIYADSHKNEINQRAKLYRVSNKEHIKERRSKLFVCKCGSEINYSSKSQHLKTKVHNDLMLCKNVTSV
jgi:hypothetical protein